MSMVVAWVRECDQSESCSFARISAVVSASARKFTPGMPARMVVDPPGNSPVGTKSVSQALARDQSVFVRSKFTAWTSCLSAQISSSGLTSRSSVRNSTRLPG